MAPVHAPIRGTYNNLASPKESADGAVALLSTSEGDKSSLQDHFVLEAGQTSLTDRVANLSKQNRSFDVVALLETALNRSDEHTVGALAQMALTAYDRMEPGDARHVLRDILADWGIDSDNQPRPPRPSFTVLSFPAGPGR